MHTDPFTFDTEAIDPETPKHLAVTQHALEVQTARLAEVEASFIATFTQRFFAR